MEWAVSDITALDGRLRRDGLDLETMLHEPLRRFVAVLYSLYIENVSWVSDEAERKKLRAIVEWPDVQEQRDIEESDREARAALAAYGVSVDFGAAARARQTAMQGQQESIDHNEPVQDQGDSTA